MIFKLGIKIYITFKISKWKFRLIWSDMCIYCPHAVYNTKCRKNQNLSIRQKPNSFITITFFQEKNVFAKVFFFQNTYNYICGYFTEWVHGFIWYLSFTQELKNCWVSEHIYQKQKRLEKEKKEGQQGILVKCIQVSVSNYLPFTLILSLYFTGWTLHK